MSSVADGTINCACHGSQYSIETGDVEEGPATFRARRGRRSPSRATRSAWPERPRPAAHSRQRRRAASAGGRAGRRAAPGPRRPVGPQQRGDPGLLDDLALGVGAAEPPARAAARPARRRPPSTARRPAGRRARASGATTSRWVGWACAAAHAARAGRGRPVVERQQRDRACMARNGVAGRSSTSRPVSAATCSSSGTSAASGVSAQRNSSEPVSTSARQPRPCSGRSWAS